MNTKNIIIQELNQLPETLLPKVLESIRQLSNSEQNKAKERVWKAYLESEQENEEVYQRLANSWISQLGRRVSYGFGGEKVIVLLIAAIKAAGV